MSTSTTALLAFVALALLLHAIGAATALPLPGVTLIDPDSYMRLVRVQALLDGGGWFDGKILRADAPYGDTLHWTRPLDVLLLVLSAPLRLFLPPAASLHWAGVVVSPLAQIALCVAALWCARPLHGGQALWALPALLVQPSVFAYAAAGRADHHMLILLAFMLALGCTLRALLSGDRQRAALYAGLLTGFGMWLSIEFALPASMLSGAFVGAWLLAPAKSVAGPGRQWLRFALGLFLMCLLAQDVERPPSGWLTVEFDRISIVHVAASALGLVAALALTKLGHFGRAPRLALLLVTAFVAAKALLYAFPGIERGPMAEVDPRVMTLFVDRVIEMRSLWPRSLAASADALQHLGVLLLALPALAALLWKNRGQPQFLAWAFILAATLVASAVTLLHFRFAPLAACLAVLPLAAALGLLFDTTRRWIAPPLGLALGTLAVALALLLPSLLGSAVGALGRTAAAVPPTLIDCPLEPIVAALRDDPELAAPRIILANSIGLGPLLLYRTPHAVVATPYHRNARGIVDTAEVFNSIDDAAARAVIERRGVGLVLVCRAVGGALWSASRDGIPTLNTRLATGIAPDWLAEVALPPAAAAYYALYAVRPGETGR